MLSKSHSVNTFIESCTTHLLSVNGPSDASQKGMKNQDNSVSSQGEGALP